MADGAGGVEARLETLAAAVMEQTKQIAAMGSEMKSFMNRELAAKQELKIRIDTDQMIKEANRVLEEKISVSRALEDQKTYDAAKQYTDEQVAALVEELAAREERDQKMEAKIRASIWGVIGVGTLGVAFALYEILRNGGG